MKHAALYFGFLFIVATPVHASLPVVEFNIPAQANGTLYTEGPQWALLVFRESSEAQFALDLQPQSTINYSEVFTDFEVYSAKGTVPNYHIESAEGMEGNFRAGMFLGDGWSSIYIEADSIRFNSSAVDATLGWSNGRTSISEYLPEREVPEGTHSYGIVPQLGLLWAVESTNRSANFPVTLQADGIHRLQWHNATLECSDSPCLDGAKDQGVTMPVAGGFARSRMRSIREVTSSSGTLQGHGTPMAAVVGSSLLTSAEVNGWLRLPKAHIIGTCSDAPCADPAGQTLQVKGRLRLEGMGLEEETENRVTSSFVAYSAVARIDESPAFDLTASSAWAIAAVSGAGLLVVAWKALLGLFARNTRPLLDHPRAKAIHDLVHATPGLSFKEIERATGWAHGSVQYHLKRLLKAGLIVAYAHQNGRQTYYENHGRHKEDWKAYAALRKPELQKLHEWIANHPQAKQGGIIEAMAELGWKRATTQRRLKNLMAAGLIQEYRPSVLAVHYVAVHPQAARNPESRSSAAGLGEEGRQPI